MSTRSHEWCHRKKDAAVVGALLLSLCVGGLYWARTVRAADDRTITDDERTDDDDKVWTEVINRLETLVRLTKLAARPHDTTVGITAAQTARLSVFVRVRDADRPRPVRVRLTVFDGEGTPLGVKEGTLSAGHVVFLDLAGADLRLGGGDRLQIYGLAEVNAPENARRRVKAALELFDSETGVTDIAMPLPTNFLTISQPPAN